MRALTRQHPAARAMVLVTHDAGGPIGAMQATLAARLNGAGRAPAQWEPASPTRAPVTLVDLTRALVPVAAGIAVGGALAAIAALPFIG